MTYSSTLLMDNLAKTILRNLVANMFRTVENTEGAFNGTRIKPSSTFPLQI